MENLRCGVSAKITNAGCFILDCPGQLPGGSALSCSSSIFELVVLTIEAVEGTGMVEHGQVVMAMLSPFGDSIRGVATARAARTNKVSHAVGGKRIIVIRKIALVRTAAFYGAAFHSTKSAEAHAAFRDSALMHTKLAGDASLCPGRVFRKTIRLSATIVNRLNYRPHFFKISSDTIYAETNYS